MVHLFIGRQNKLNVPCQEYQFQSESNDTLSSNLNHSPTSKYLTLESILLDLFDSINLIRFFMSALDPMLSSITKQIPCKQQQIYLHQSFLILHKYPLIDEPKHRK